MPFAAYGDPVFGLQDGKVGKWVSTGVYSTPLVDLMSIQMMSVAAEPVTADLTGDDRITAVATRLTMGSFTVRFGGSIMEVLSVVFGLTPTVTGITPALVQQMLLPGGQRFPYFGMIGQALAEEGGGDQLVFIPKAKVTSSITLASNTYGEFQTIEFTARAVDDEDYGLINIIRRQTTGAFTMPPAGITPLA